MNISLIMSVTNIAEAIAIADEVIVLSKRPAQIKKIFPIKLTDASTPIHNRTCKEFGQYYKEIWQVFDHEI